MIRIYISGPMSDVADFNHPAFAAEAHRLRAMGFDVESPAESGSCASWEAYMRQALIQMLSCDYVSMLPGWRGSRGALIEHTLAGQLSMPEQEMHTTAFWLHFGAEFLAGFAEYTPT